MTTDIGRAVLDALVQLNRRHKSGIFVKNLQFKNGLAFEYDFDHPLQDCKPKTTLERARNPFEAPKIHLDLKPELLSKLREAMAGGTQEKLEYLASLGRRIDEEDSVDEE